MLYLVILSVLLVGCGQMQLNLLKRMGRTYPVEEPITIYIEVEKDLTGSYIEKLEFYELDSFRTQVTRALEEKDMELWWNKQEIAAGVRGIVRNIENPLRVVQDSSEADLLLRVGIEVFEFNSGEALKSKLSNLAWFGPLGGILSSDKPIAAFAARCFVIDAMTKNIIYRFTAVGRSKGGLNREVAYAQAINKGAQDFILRLLRPVSFGSRADNSP